MISFSDIQKAMETISCKTCKHWAMFGGSTLGNCHMLPINVGPALYVSTPSNYKCLAWEKK